MDISRAQLAIWEDDLKVSFKIAKGDTNFRNDWNMHTQTLDDFFLCTTVQYMQCSLKAVRTSAHNFFYPSVDIGIVHRSHLASPLLIIKAVEVPLLLAGYSGTRSTGSGADGILGGDPG